MKKNEIFIMVWIDETETWHYFKERFDPSVYKDGYTDYRVRVEDGIIVDDEWHEDNVGKKFEDCYEITRWAAEIIK